MALVRGSLDFAVALEPAYSLLVDSSYRAVVAGDRIHWIDQPPGKAGPLEVRVTIVEGPDARAARRERVLEALEALARIGGIGGIVSRPSGSVRDSRGCASDGSSLRK